MLTRSNWAPSATSTDTEVAYWAVPACSKTTVARAWRPTRSTMVPQTTSGDTCPSVTGGSPVSRNTTGSVSSASGAMSISTALSLLVTAAAASRSIGAGTPIARTCSVSTVVTVIPPGGSYFQLNWPGEGAPGNSPASRLTGVKRQI